MFVGFSHILTVLTYSKKKGHRLLRSVISSLLITLSITTAFSSPLYGILADTAHGIKNPGIDIPSNEECSCLDERAIAVFQRLGTHSRGIMPNLPIEIRMCRTGDIEQEVSISKKGILTVITRFSYRKEMLPQDKSNEVRVHVPHSEEETPSIIPCQRKKSFRLSEFAKGRSCRYEVNRTMNCLVLYDGATPCHLAFQSKTDLKQAETLFSILVNQSTHSLHPAHITVSDSVMSVSQALHTMGYRWLALAPRYETVDEMINIVTSSKKLPSQRCLLWLSALDPISHPEEFLKEGKNISPIFLYELTQLDESIFTSLPYIGAQEERLFSTPFQKQSISSHDLFELVQEPCDGSALPIRLEAHVRFPMPRLILCRKGDIAKIQKAIDRQAAPGEKPSYPQFIGTTPRFYHQGIPEGGTLKWLAGISNTSDDCLRALFFDPNETLSEIASHLYREFPLLRTLLQAKSHIRKGLTIQASLIAGMRMLAQKIESFDPVYRRDVSAIRRVQLATLLACEASLLYGPPSSMHWNGTQYAIIVLEKLGAPWSERIAAEHIFSHLPEFTSSNKATITSQATTPANTLLQEGIAAQTIGVPLCEWLKVQMTVLSTLHRLAPFSKSVKAPLQRVKQLISQLPEPVKSGELSLPYGTAKGYQGMHQRPLYSAYYWEKLDIPHHRDGLSLKRMRERYEEHMIHHPSSDWRDRFWEWIRHKQELNEAKLFPSAAYLSAEERKQHIAVFNSDGTMIAPQELCSEGMVEATFVVGIDGHMYVGKKVDAEHPEDISFSHASFFSGAPVASSGKFMLHNGKVVSMTDHSGHYRPTEIEVIIALVTLKKLGVDISSMKVLHSASISEKKMWDSGEQFLSDHEDTYKKLIARGLFK